MRAFLREAMAKSLYDLILEARRLTNTQRNLFVTNPEIGDWVNKGIKALYDAIIEADRSYYNTTQDYTLAGTSDATAQAALPADFYLARGVTRFPDTRNARPVFARNFTMHDIGGQDGGVFGGGEPGYLFRGNNFTIVPYQAAGSGPWRLTYVPKAPQLNLSAVVPIAVTPGVDGAATGGASEIRITTTGMSAGQSVFVTGTADPGNSGEFVITNVLDGTHIQVNPFCNSPELYTSAVTVNLGLSPSARLDVTMDNYDSVPSLWAAIRIMEKKKQGAEELSALLGQELSRVAAITSGRAAEPEAAPVLWAPSNYPLAGYGPFGSGNDFGP